jgi:hypothetical protein
LPKQFHRFLTILPRKAYLPYIRRTLRVEYNTNELTPDEALLIAGNVAYDKQAAARLLKESGKTAAQLVIENPRRKPRAKWKRRLHRWLMSLEGSESFAAAHNRCLASDYRKELYEEE